MQASCPDPNESDALCSTISFNDLAGDAAEHTSHGRFVCDDTSLYELIIPSFGGHGLRVSNISRLGQGRVRSTSK